MANTQKAKQAMHALRAVGIDSAASTDNGMVAVSPEDAMKMLLLTDEDRQGLFAGEQKIRLGIKSEVADLKGRLARLTKLANHSPELCKKGEHITESYPTGGRSGHCVTRCLACDYREDGYD